MSNNLGIILRKARQEKKLSRKNVAHRIGVSSQTICNIETNKRVSLKMLMKLNEFLKIEFWRLLKEAGFEEEIWRKHKENNNVLLECDTLGELIICVQRVYGITLSKIEEETRILQATLLDIKQGSRKNRESTIIAVCAYLDEIVPGTYEKFVINEFCDKEQKNIDLEYEELLQIVNVA